MLGAFVRNGLSQRRIESEVLFQIIAGSDTTATGLRATILYLITAPRVMEKLRAEIDAAEAAGIISNPIQNAEAKGLPFLQACIKEGLRMLPPFTGLVMKKVPPGGDTIKGQYVPGNTSIGHNTWSIQRNEVYGEDPDVFRPERWIDADSETVVQMERTLELVFGYGRWGCLGKSIAYMELNKFFVEVSRRHLLMCSRFAGCSPIDDSSSAALISNWLIRRILGNAPISISSSWTTCGYELRSVSPNKVRKNRRGFETCRINMHLEGLGFSFGPYFEFSGVVARLKN